MTWFSQSANETESAKEHVSIFIAVDINLPSGIKRFWTGIGALTFGGNTYTGVGMLGSVGVAPDHVQLTAERKTYALSGIDPTLVLETDIDNSYGRDLTEYFGFLTQQGTLVATPEVNWEGLIDSFRRVDGTSPVIEIAAESRLLRVDKTDNWRYTHDHQQVFYSGDTGFNLIASVPQMQIIWGNGVVSPGSNNRSGDQQP